MGATEECLGLDGAVAGLLLIPFEDAELREFVASAAVTQLRSLLVLQRWFGFVGALARFGEFALSLPVVGGLGLLLSSLLGVWHAGTQTEEGHNGVVGHPRGRGVDADRRDPHNR